MFGNSLSQIFEILDVLSALKEGINVPRLDNMQCTMTR